MEFAFDARTEDLHESLFDFMGSHVYRRPEQAHSHSASDGSTRAGTARHSRASSVVACRLTADDALHEARCRGGPDITDLGPNLKDIPKGMRLMFYPFRHQRHPGRRPVSGR